MIANALLPIFALLALGFVLKRTGMTSEVFLKTSDRLVYYIFFPAMLFWKIGGAAQARSAGTALCLAAILAVVLVYGLSLIVIRWMGLARFKAGAFSQACYRFNTYIGMAVVMAALGEKGVQYFGILIGFTIPVINILAVGTLIAYSGRKKSFREHWRHLIRTLLSNPLILGCAAGLLFSGTGLRFPAFVNATFSLMTSVTMPLALISIGGSLTLSGLKHNMGPALTASVLKLLVLPLVGALTLRWFLVAGVPAQVGMIFFALPTSTSIYVLSARMESDLETASTAVVMTTLLSFVSMSAVLMMG